MTALHQHATRALAAGLSVLPAATDGTKRPAITWRQYQHQKPTVDNLHQWFNGDSYDGLGYVCGTISGNLEMFEFEARAVQNGTYDLFLQAAATAGHQFVDRIDAGYTERSPSGGIHWLYRVANTPVAGNLKLARQHDTTTGEIAVLIETRGEGGWTVAAPSAGRTHNSRQPWQILHGDIATIATITADQQHALHQLARTFDRMPATNNSQPAPPARTQPYDGPERPGDTFNRTTTWHQLLEPHGWQHVYTQGETGHWRRPGKTDGISATTNANGTDRLCVHSTSTVFDTSPNSYDKLGAHALLNHGGSLAAAVKAAVPPQPDRPVNQLIHASSPAAEHDQNRDDKSDGTGDVPGRKIVLTPASSIQPKKVQWLWSGRIPQGALTLLGGREGIGKSTYAYDLVADLTRGQVPGIWKPDNTPGTPKPVLIAATEDSWEHTIVPRLMAAKANLNIVYRVDVDFDGAPGVLTLPSDLIRLAQAVTDSGAALILLDPLMSRLDARLDSHKDAEVRQALEPLTRIADETACAILGIIHVNKTSGSDPLTTLMGSRAFAAVARAVLFVARDPDEDHIRLLGQPKNNLGRTDLPTLRFEIVDTLAATTEEGDIRVGKLSWAGETEMTIADAIDAGAGTKDERTAILEASDWLNDYLTMKGGADESKAVKEAARKEGHSDRTLGRARQKIGVIAEPHGMPRKTYWKLPTALISSDAKSLGRHMHGTTTIFGTTGVPVSPVVPVVPPCQGYARDGATGEPT